MPGMRVYKQLSLALRDGFQVYDRTKTGYIVRRKNGDRWEMALVELTVPMDPPRNMPKQK